MTDSETEASVPVPAHANVASWRGATDADIDLIHELMLAAGRVDHPTWVTAREDVADEFEWDYVDMSRDRILGFTADGTLIAEGFTFVHPSRDEKLMAYLGGTVHPDWRRRGIGRVIVDWLASRSREQVAEIGGALPVEYKIYASDHQPDLVTIAGEAGFVPERWFATMQRDLADAVPELPDTDGIRIIEYTSDRDEDARVARNDAFRDHWGSLPSVEQNWRQFVGGPHFRADLSRLAVDESGAIVAFCLSTVNEDDWEALGAPHSYISLIGVVRSHRG